MVADSDMTPIASTFLYLSDTYSFSPKWLHGLVQMDEGNFTALVSSRLIRFDTEGHEISRIASVTSRGELAVLSDGRIAHLDNDPTGVYRILVRTLAPEEMHVPVFDTLPLFIPPLTGTQTFVEFGEGNLGRVSSIVPLDKGEFIVGWTEMPGTGNPGPFNVPSTEFGETFVQVFDGKAEASGAPLVLHDLTAGPVRGADLAITQDGFLSVAVDDGARDGDGSGIFLSSWSWNEASLQFIDLQVNVTTELDQRFPKITELADGRFVVSYVSYDGELGPLDDAVMMGRFLDLQGRPIGEEFHIGSGRTISGLTWDNVQNPFHAFDYEVVAFPEGGFAVIVEEGERGISPIEYSTWVSVYSPNDDHLETRTLYSTSGFGFAQGEEAMRLLAHREGYIERAIELETFELGGDAVFRGSAAADILSGTDKGEVFFGGAASDMMIARGGDDVLRGGLGHDHLSGGTGNDMLDGGAGDDVIAGGEAADLSGTVAGQVYRLYRATLDRAPDTDGFKNWVDRLETGDSAMQDIATGFLGSAEFQDVYRDLSDTDFVTLLYDNVLDRAPDAAGLDNWVQHLSDGNTRASVVVGFSESMEFRIDTAFEASAYTQALSGRARSDILDDVFRLYQTTLDRAPDAAGLEGWSEQLVDGAAYTTIARGFTRSAEFTNTYGTLEDNAFINQLYRNVLDREGDAGGLVGWQAVLDDGGTREDVVRGFAQSREFINNTSADFEAYMKAGGGDELDGGAGNDTLYSVATADTFVFDASEDGTDKVLQLDTWDTLQFEGFGYSAAADALAKMSAVGSDVRFNDQGVEIVFAGANLTTLQEVDYLFA